jgi:hypothetical protein
MHGGGRNRSGQSSALVWNATSDVRQRQARDAPWSCGNQAAYHSMINRHSVPALHRACLHLIHQPERRKPDEILHPKPLKTDMTTDGEHQIPSDRPQDHLGGELPALESLIPPYLCCLSPFRHAMASTRLDRRHKDATEPPSGAASTEQPFTEGKLHQQITLPTAPRIVQPSTTCRRLGGLCAIGDDSQLRHLKVPSAVRTEFPALTHMVLAEALCIIGPIHMQSMTGTLRNR